MQYRKYFFALITLLSASLLNVQAVHAVEFTMPTTIGASTTTHDGGDIIVTGTTLTIDGNHSFNSITLQSGATLTHSTATSSKPEITVSTITVDATSKSHLNSSGLLPPTSVNGNSGGSYGGAGGASGGVSNAVFGDYQSPVGFWQRGKQYKW